MGYKPKSYHKFVAGAATAVLAASAVTPALAASFTDVPGPYKEAVNYLISNKVAEGTSRTTFGTNLTIKRVDAAVMLAKALKLNVDKGKDTGFTDVPKRARAYVATLKEAGIISGKTNKLFAPDQNITRGEAAIMLAKAYNITGDPSKLPFTDVAPLYREAVAALVDNEITSGKTEKTFGTDTAIKRGEFAIFLYKLSKLKQQTVISVPQVTATASGTAKISASVQGAPADAEATVDILAEGKVAATKKVKVTDGKVIVDFTGLSAGKYVAKITVNGQINTASFVIEKVEAPKVTVTNVAAATSNNLTKVTAIVEGAADNTDAKVAIFKKGDSTSIAAQTVKVVSGKVTADFTGLPVGALIIKVTVGEVTGEGTATIEAPPASGGGGGGGGGGPIDTAAPDTPKVNKVENDDVEVTGTAEANSTVTVKAGATVLGTAKADAKGAFVVKIAVQKAGTTLVVTATDAAGNVSKAAEITVVKSDTENTAIFSEAAYNAGTDTLTITGLNDIEEGSVFDLAKLVYSDGERGGEDEREAEQHFLSSDYAITISDEDREAGTYFYNEDNRKLSIVLTADDATAVEGLAGFGLKGTAEDALRAEEGWNIDKAENKASEVEGISVEVTPE